MNIKHFWMKSSFMQRMKKLYQHKRTKNALRWSNLRLSCTAAAAFVVTNTSIFLYHNNFLLHELLIAILASNLRHISFLPHLRLFLCVWFLSDKKNVVNEKFWEEKTQECFCLAHIELLLLKFYLKFFAHRHTFILHCFLSHNWINLDYRSQKCLEFFIRVQFLLKIKK